LARAQLAAKDFGIRAGAQLAEALKPGFTSLDQFATSSTDTIGATNKAAQAVEDDWGSRFTLLMHQAGGTLATFGQSFGPLLMVGAQLGPKMASALGALGTTLIPVIAKQLGLTLPTWAAGGTAAGVAEVQGEAAAVALGGPEVGAAVAAQAPEVAAGGTALGTVIGTAEVQGEAAAVALGGPEVGAAVAVLAPEAAAAGTVLGTVIGTAAAIAIPIAIPLAIGGALVIAGGILGGWWSDLVNSITGRNPTDFSQYSNAPSPAALKAQQDAQDAALTYATNATDAKRAQLQAASDLAITSRATATKAVIDQATKDGYSGIPTIVQAQMFEATKKVADGMAASVTAITNSRSAIMGAFSAAFSATIRPEELARQLKTLAEQMNDPKLLKAIATGTSADKPHNLAVEQMDQLKMQHAELLVEQATYGTKAEQIAKTTGLLTSKELLDGLKSANPDTKLLWETVQATTQTQLDLLNGIANTAGQNAGQALLDGISSQAPAAGAAWNLFEYGHSPTAPVSAPKAKTYSSTVGLPGYAEGGFWTSPSAIVGEAGRERLDRMSDGSVKVTPLGGGATTSTRTTIINVQGLVQAKTPEDIARVLRRAEAF
jgi:hypothetical protein